jgi:hypothetical protein
MFERIEKYYGSYENPNLKNLVRNYLLKDYDPKKFDEILKSILYFHKAIFKAPCIATIEECIKKARLEKGQTDPHKGTETKNRWDFREQAKTNPEFEKVDIDLKAMFNKTIKKV